MGRAMAAGMRAGDQAVLDAYVGFLGSPLCAVLTKSSPMKACTVMPKWLPSSFCWSAKKTWPRIIGAAGGAHGRDRTADS